jgi:hypothetical protein
VVRNVWQPISASMPAALARGESCVGLVHGAVGHVRVPEMLVGTIAACPVFGGKLKAVDDKPALAVKGVKAVVKLPDAVAVVGEGYWPCKKRTAGAEPPMGRRAERNARQRAHRDGAQRRFWRRGGGRGDPW